MMQNGVIIIPRCHLDFFPSCARNVVQHDVSMASYSAVEQLKMQTDAGRRMESFCCRRENRSMDSLFSFSFAISHFLTTLTVWGGEKV